MTSPPTPRASAGLRRVVLATRLFPPEPGAAAFRLGALVRTLEAREVDVEVLTTRPPRHLAAPRPTPGPADRRVRVRRWPVLRDAGGNVRGYVQYASFDLPLVLRLLVARRPDLVVVEPPPTTGVVVRLVSALRRIPYAYYAGDVSTTAAAGIGTPGPVVAVLRRVETWVLRGARRVLAVSDGVARDVHELAGADVPVDVVGTGVDTDTFRPRERRPGSRTLVYAGTMSEIQGAAVFVHAFLQVLRSHPDAELVLYGQGSEAARLRELAAAAPAGRIRFPGVVSGDEVATALSGAAAGLASLHPGVGYDFAFPTKMFAVTACGTPVVYAGPGPGRTMVAEHGLGWAVDWDVDAVAAAMRAALETDWSDGAAQRLATWTRATASQDTVAAAAADALTAAVEGR